MNDEVQEFINLESAIDLLNRGDENFEAGEFEKATRYYKRGAELASILRYYCYYRIGWSYYLTGKYDLALEMYDKGIALKDDYAYLHLNRGVLLKKHFGNQAEADVCFRKCIELEEGKIDESVCWHHACAELGMRAKAIEVMDRLLDEFPNKVGFYFDAACVYCQLQDYDLALDYLGTCLGKGYSIQHVLFDPDIEVLRGFDKYKAIIDYYKNPLVGEAPYTDLSRDCINENIENQGDVAIPEDIICPHCGKGLERIDHYCYFQWNGGKCSDLRHQAPQTIVPSIVQNCPHCGEDFAIKEEFLLITDASKVNFIEPVELPELYDSALSYCLPSSSFKWNNATQEYNQRLRFLWAYNDYFYRKDSDRSEPNEIMKIMHHHNIYELLKFIKDPLIKVDLIRQAGDFDECISQVDSLLDFAAEEARPLLKLIKQKAKIGSSAPFQLYEEEQIKELFQTSLSELDFSRNIIDAFNSLHLECVGDLVNCDHKALTELVGMKRMTELEEFMESLSLPWYDQEGYAQYLADWEDHSQMMKDAKDFLDSK